MSKRTTVLLALLLIASLCALLFVGNRAVLFETEVHEMSDFAVNALQIDRAKHGQELLGNYSKFHFNHPGPAFFYVYAAGERILHDWLGWVPSPYNAHVIAGGVLQVTFFTIALLLLAHVFGNWRILWVALGIAALHFARVPHLFLSIWPPEVLMMPFLAFLAACVGLALGRTAFLPWAILSGSFLVHGHVAQPLFVLVLFVGAVVGWGRAQRQPTGHGWGAALRQHAFAIVTAGLLLALFILPLMLDALRGADSNIAAILRHLRTTNTDDKTVLQALVYFVSFANYVDRPEELVLAANQHRLFFYRPGLLLVWTLSAAVWLGSYWRLRRRDDAEARGLRTLLTFWCLAVILCVYWGLMQTGPMFAYNGHFYFGLHFLVYVGALMVLTRRLHRWLRYPTAFLFLLAGFATFGSRINHEPSFADPRGLVVRDAAFEALRLQPSAHPKLLVFEHEYWSEAAMVGLALHRAGQDFRVGPAWEFMFQPRYTIDNVDLEPVAFPFDVWRIVRDPRVEPAIPVTRDRHLVFAPAPLAPDGGLIRFDVPGEMYHFLLSGISSPEANDGAWTDDERAFIQFQPGRAEHGVDLQIVAYPFLIRDRVPLQPTVLWFNEHLIFSAPFVAPGVLRAFIPAELWNERPVATIRLHLPNANAPAELGLWGDTRFLALSLQRLTTEYRIEETP